MARKTMSVLLSLMMMIPLLAAFAEAAPLPAADALPAPSAAEQPADSLVLATIDGETVTKGDADRLIPIFIEYEYIADASDYRTTVEFLVRQKILDRKISEMNFDVFTQEEQEAFRLDAQAQWDAAVEEYVTYYLSEDTEEARVQLRGQAEQYYASQGMTLDSLYADLCRQGATDNLSEYMRGAYVPSQQEVDAVFQTYGAYYQSLYENDIANYEFMTRLYGQESWYTPEGYRGVTHILLKVDEELLGNYQTLRASLEEAESMRGAEETEDTETESLPAAETDPETADGTDEQAAAEPATPEKAEEARVAILQSKKNVTEEIYARLAAGEAFESLIGEFGEDPGMASPENLAGGYMVHRSSVIWDPMFVEGAFSEKMQQAGDVSDPVISSNGIHIIKYLRDVPSGLVLTDAIREEIVEYLNSAYESEQYRDAFSKWELEYDIVYDEEAIDAATASVSSQEGTGASEFEAYGEAEPAGTEGD